MSSNDHIDSFELSEDGVVSRGRYVTDATGSALILQVWRSGLHQSESGFKQEFRRRKGRGLNEIIQSEIIQSGGALIGLPKRVS
ncbi:MAG TPA: hypothetical protein VI756_33105, partial [Blastocatellia bacterium]